MTQTAIHRQAREAAQRTKALRDAALQRRSSPISTYISANTRFAAELAGARRPWWPVSALGGVRWPRGFRPLSLRGRPWLRGAAMASGLILLVGATHALAPAVTETVAGAIMRTAPGSSALMEEFRQREECFLRVAVEGPTGQIAGVLRTGGCEGLPEGLQHSPPYLTAEVTEAEARRLADFIGVLEGDHRRGRSTLLGHELMGFARVAAYLVRGERIGGSSGLQTAVKNTMGSAGSLSFWEKLVAIWQTAVIAAHSSDEERDRIVAMHAPPIFTTENDIFGPSLAGRLIPYAFGKSTISQMSDAEVCLAAAALPKQIILHGAGESDESRAKWDVRNEQVKARAIKYCVGRLEARGTLSAAEATAARDEIRALHFDHLGQAPRLDNRLAHTLPGARLIMQDALDRRERQLDTGALVTTLEPASQAKFHADVEQLVSSTDAGSWDDGALCPPWGACSDGNERVDILSVVLEETVEGEEMRLGYSTRPGLWQGPGTTLTRSLGSVPKLLMIPYFASRGVETLCRRQWADLHDGDFGGYYDCSLPAAQLSLRDVVGQSDNLGYAEALRSAGFDGSLEYLRGLGFTVPASADNLETQRQVAANTNVLAKPAVAARALTAISRGAQGRAPVARAVTPFGLEETEIDLRELVALEGARQQIRSALGGALDQGGTLNALAPPLARRGCDLATTYAKTGTSEATRETGERRVRDRLIFLRTMCAGRALTVATLVGSPRIDVPLSQISGGDMRRLVLDALDAVLHR